MKKGSDMAYDVFISYRRKTGLDDARLLQQALKARGYKVFFDYESLRVGKFNEKIFEAIDEASVFILMLSRGALDECAYAGDWVRAEIERAICNGRQIIPVSSTLQNLSFPDNLPPSLREIPFMQVSELNKASLFEESVDKIVENCFPDYLKRRSRLGFGTTSAAPSPRRVNSIERQGRKGEIRRSSLGDKIRGILDYWPGFLLLAAFLACLIWLLYVRNMVGAN